MSIAATGCGPSPPAAAKNLLGHRCKPFKLFKPFKPFKPFERFERFKPFERFVVPFVGRFSTGRVRLLGEPS